MDENGQDKSNIFFDAYLIGTTCFIVLAIIVGIFLL